MTRAGASAVVRTGVAAVGVAALVLSMTLVERSRGTSYAGASASFEVLEVSAAIALLVAAVLLLRERPTAVLGTLAVAAVVAWLAPSSTGWEDGPPALRSASLVVAALLSPIVLAIAVQIPPVGRGIRRMGAIAVVVMAVGATAAAAVATSLVRDPIRELDCWSDCTVSAFLVHDDPQLAHRFMSALLVAGAASGALAALVGAVRLARVAAAGRRRSGPALAAASLAGLALAAYAVALARGSRELPHRPSYEWLFVARSLALVLLGAALCWIVLRPHLVRGSVTRLAVDLERSSASGGLGPRLARELGDPRLRLGYPIGPGQRVVDTEGGPIAFDPARVVTPIVGRDGVVALVETDVTVEVLERELGPAAHLAVGNERLRAEAIARLEDVTASRARIVETADLARRRMERDLHDGAQQRMLALTYDLRVALTMAEAAADERAAAPLRAALERARAAAEDLRDVAHGIFPDELTRSGLAAALESLADLRPLRIVDELPAGRRYGADVESAAYAVVAEASEDGRPLAVALSEAAGELRVDVDGDVDWDERLVRFEDRVGAAGGSVRAAARGLEVRLPVV